MSSAALELPPVVIARLKQNYPAYLIDEMIEDGDFVVKEENEKND
jgi:hypothetical protein